MCLEKDKSPRFVFPSLTLEVCAQNYTQLYDRGLSHNRDKNIYKWKPLLKSDLLYLRLFSKPIIPRVLPIYTSPKHTHRQTIPTISLQSPRPLARYFCFNSPLKNIVKNKTKQNKKLSHFVVFCFFNMKSLFMTQKKLKKERYNKHTNTHTHRHTH